MAAQHPSHLQETRLQGSFTFPCTMYFASGQEGEDPPFILKAHWHSATEILHLVKGDYLCGFNTESFRVKEEAFCFAAGATLHSMTCRGSYQEEALVFDPDILSSATIDESIRQILKPLKEGTLELPLVIREGEEAFGPIREVYARLSQIYLTQGIPSQDQRLIQWPAAQLRVKASLMELLAILIEYGLTSQKEKAPDPRLDSLKSVMDYIRENYQEKIYLKDLSSIMNMNEQYFCRFFKKATGKTPMAYINELRIKEASRLLEDTSQSISRIATSCGFSNQGHFITCFKKINSLSPLEYRKRQSQKKGGAQAQPEDTI